MNAAHPPAMPAAFPLPPFMQPHAAAITGSRMPTVAGDAAEASNGAKMIGVYDPVWRKIRLARYRQKRRELVFDSKRIKYPSRSSICQERMATSGKFTDEKRDVDSHWQFGEDPEIAKKRELVKRKKKKVWPVGPAPYFYKPWKRRHGGPKCRPTLPRCRRQLYPAKRTLVQISGNAGIGDASGAAASNFGTKCTEKCINRCKGMRWFGIETAGVIRQMHAEEHGLDVNLHEVTLEQVPTFAYHLSKHKRCAESGGCCA